MTVLYFLITATFIFILTITGYSQKRNEEKQFPLLKGEYLGQKPPGLIPEVFAPGIISTAVREMCIWFAPGGRELYFVRKINSRRTILCIKEENNCWTSPEVVPFSGKHDDGEIFKPDN